MYPRETASTLPAAPGTVLNWKTHFTPRSCSLPRGTPLQPRGRVWGPKSRAEFQVSRGAWYQDCSHRRFTVSNPSLHPSPVTDGVTELPSNLLLIDLSLFLKETKVLCM